MPQRAVFKTVDRQAGALVGVLAGKVFIDVDAMSRCFARREMAVLEAIGMGEDFIDAVFVRHVFLDAEVGHPGIEMQGRAHAHR